MEEGEIEGKPSLISSPECAVVLSKTQLKRLKRQQERLNNREQWLAWKKLKRKARQLASRQQKTDLLHTLPGSLGNGPQQVSMNRESSLPDRRAEKIPIHQESPTILFVFDLSFDDHMQPKERSSLCLQLCRSYGVNRRALHPVYFLLTSVSEEALKTLTKMNVHQWKGVTIFRKHWSQLTKEDLVVIGLPFTHVLFRNMESSSVSVCNKSADLLSKFVYLTGDAQDALQDLSSERIYIIGGIVDKNRHKNLTLSEAKKYAIHAQKLPIREHVSLKSSSILTCNQIFELISRYLSCHSWSEALHSVIPQRKKNLSPAE